MMETFEIDTEEERKRNEERQKNRQEKIENNRQEEDEDKIWLKFVELTESDWWKDK